MPDFIPNNAVAPARRMRIHKAREYGAERAEAWSDIVTHIIVDKDLNHGDVLKHLKLEDIPVRLHILCLQE